jgi:hypothetical protein
MHRTSSFFAIVSLVIVALPACSDEDTVLALNFTVRQSASGARTLAVSVTQPGQSPVETTVDVATKESDAGIVLKNTTFFERIVLPAGYTEAEASVQVVAKDASGAQVGMGSATVGIRPAGAVAGYVTLGEDPKMPPEMKPEMNSTDAGAAAN